MTRHYRYILSYLVLFVGLSLSAGAGRAAPLPPEANPNYFYDRETAFVITHAMDDINGGVYLAVNPDGSTGVTLSGAIWGIPVDVFGNNPMQGTDKSLFGHGTCIRYFITEYQRVRHLEATGEPGLQRLNDLLNQLGGTPLNAPEDLLGYAQSCADFVINNMVIDPVDDGVTEDPWNYTDPGSGGGKPDIGDVVNPDRLYYWSAVSADASTRFVDDTLPLIASTEGAPRAESIVPWSMTELALAMREAGLGNWTAYRDAALDWYTWRTTTAEDVPAFTQIPPPPPDDATACVRIADNGLPFNFCVAGGARDTFLPAVGFALTELGAGATYRADGIAYIDDILGTDDFPDLTYPPPRALNDSTYIAGFSRGVLFAYHSQFAPAAVSDRNQWWDFGNFPAVQISDFTNVGGSPPFSTNLNQPFTHFYGRELLAGTQRALWFYYTFGENPDQAFPDTGTFSNPADMRDGTLSLWNYTNAELWDTVDGQEAWYESGLKQYKPCFSAGTDLPLGDWQAPLIGDKVHALNDDNSATVSVTGVMDTEFEYLSWSFAGSGISGVDVVYTVDDGVIWEVIPAEAIDATTYEATIPPQPDNTRVYYYARARDAYQNNVAFPAGAETWNTAGLTLEQSIENSQTYITGSPESPTATPTETPAITPTATGTAVPTETPTPAGIPDITPTPAATAEVSETGILDVAAPSPLTVVKGIDERIAIPGQVITWTISVSNPNEATLNDVVISDEIADDLTILEASSSAGTVVIDGQTITVTIATLQPGQTVRITIRTQVSDAPSVTVIDNRVGTAEVRLTLVTVLPRTGETPWWHPCHLVGVCRD
jgi:uncharacterized repeat protein (TIGR01451 family)